MEEKQLVQDEEYSFPYHYIPQYKDGFSQHASWDWSKNYISAAEFIIEQIKNDKNISSIADVGCGDGRLTREIYLELEDLDVIGIDYSSRAINLAKALNPKINFKNIDIINEDTDLRVDAVTLVEVFEHIPVDLCHRFAASLAKILNDDGTVYLTVPHTNITLSDKHEQHFDLKILKSYYDKYFNVEKVLYIQKTTLFMKFLNKFINNKYFIITHDFINTFAYNYYKSKCFFADESSCERIYLKLKKRTK
tara:strand:+ start:291 stop:1040 length:750 start_codon:yes stop_codon:yes gene_type:complete